MPQFKDSGGEPPATVLAIPTPTTTTRKTQHVNLLPLTLALGTTNGLRWRFLQ